MSISPEEKEVFKKGLLCFLVDGFVAYKVNPDGSTRLVTMEEFDREMKHETH